MKILSHHLKIKRGGREGSALMTVLLLLGIVSVLSASLLSLGVQEADFNGRRSADIEAKHVVESAIEMAMARLEATFKESQTITASSPDITLSAQEQAILLNDSKYVKSVRIVSVTNQLLRQRIYVDENDPDTLLDPHRGAFVNVSEWDVVAEVTLNYRQDSRTIRAVQSFQVRESPFFTHAIFYNMDLEFHPGPRMVINGPVHTNGTVWLLGSQNNGLFFLDKVSATKAIRVGTMTDAVGPDGEVFQDDWSEMTKANGSPDSHTSKDGRNVWFNTDGVVIPGTESKTLDGTTFGNLYDGYSDYMTKDAYFDSLSEDSGKLFDRTGFSTINEFLANRYNGNLVVGSSDAPVIRPQFIPDYVAEDGSGNGRNSGYSLIEPLMSGSDSSGNKNSFHKGEAEKEKYAYKAGLTFKVVYSPGGTPTAANAVQMIKNGEDRYQVKKGKKKLNEDALTDYYLVPTKTKRGNAFDMDSTDMAASPEFPVLDGDGNAVYDEEGNAVTESVLQTTADAVFLSEELVDKFARIRLYEEEDSKPVSEGGLYDKRREKALDLLEMDIGKFKDELVESTDTDRFSDGTTTTFTPFTDYNGLVYVEFPTEETVRPDYIAVAKDDYRYEDVGSSSESVGLGLMLSNAKELPNPDYNATKAPGFTLATNGTVYLKGSYNADGNSSTGSSVDADGESSAYNTLAAIAADSITFLSDAFDFSKAKNSPGDRPAEFTEVNAALMSGIVPTNKPGVDYNGDGVDDMILSGGSHNYPRFLENWSGKTFRYRGSMVAFYESEVATEPQLQTGNSYYSPPKREYGFFEEFSTGSQPPGTPMGRTFFKLDFRIL
ncbi:hypothetical protein P0Y35_05470 [Kiritimatiellaeota bacterium B1221]|nr:hypothetical protein [Kiritimatiellaeota bacterium B1221]